ncbi:NAD(P)/FAD-dependent oxidoreductase, partial [Mycolicibacterium holsaticum]|uniref:NAD(P)/FAD-dependent oxidoreductase n=1 Tax=Mycolicibacterium holsaticum TaxID=152142 RepID=UPI000A5D393D
MTERVVVVGASVGGVRTAEALRQNGFHGEILLIGAEKHAPYDRPDLSKTFLQDRRTTHADLALFKQSPRAQGIQLSLGVAASELRCDEQVLELEDGSRIAFDHCVVATGSSARRGPWRYTADMHVLRTVDDALALRKHLGPGVRVAVIGAGFVGAEVASSAAAMGCDVTVIDSAQVPLMRVLGLRIGTVLADLPRRYGVRLRLGVGVTSVAHSAEGISLTLTDGHKVDADVVVVGIGAEPTDDWLNSSGLDISDGLECDSYCRAIAHPRIYGVGDVARWYHRGYGASVRLEHWTNAVEQARAVAHNIVHPHNPVDYSPVEYVWSDQYGVKLQFSGRFSCAETFEVIGDLVGHPTPQAAILCADANRN